MKAFFLYFMKDLGNINRWAVLIAVLLFCEICFPGMPILAIVAGISSLIIYDLVHYKED